MERISFKFSNRNMCTKEGAPSLTNATTFVGDASTSWMRLLITQPISDRIHSV